jgi:hypothetical protein
VIAGANSSATLRNTRKRTLVQIICIEGRAQTLPQTPASTITQEHELTQTTPTKPPPLGLELGNSYSNTFSMSVGKVLSS